MSVAESFNKSAAHYDSFRRMLIPCFDDFYGTAVDLVGEAPVRVLDLGAGTGLLSAAIRARFPETRLDLVDLADDMLAVARQRFEGDSLVSFRTADYAVEELGGPFDAVVSALSIHHLEHPAKQALFRKIQAALKPGGVFVNADQALGTTPALEARNRTVWEKQIRARGIGDAELAAARHRQTYDRLAPLADQLKWLREAGFADVECVYKNWSFVVYTGVNSPAR